MPMDVLRMGTPLGHFAGSHSTQRVMCAAVGPRPGVVKARPVAKGEGRMVSVAGAPLKRPGPENGGVGVDRVRRRMGGASYSGLSRLVRRRTAA